MSKFDVTDRFSPCPRCSCEYAKRFNTLLTLGPIGDALFHPVKCINCQTVYNGQTGKPNGLARFAFGVALLVAGICLVLFMKDFKP
jgi:hypothetical protein